MIKNIFVLLTLLQLSCALNAQISPIYREIPDSVSVIENLTFAQYGDYDLQLDLYRPISTEILPAIVVISEGGFANGTKELNAPMAMMLAEKGFVTVSIEYRGASEALFPASVQDSKAAIRWLRANAEIYNINPNAIGAIGGSWGGYLSTYVGVTSGISELEGNGGSAEFSSHLSAVVGLSTPTNLVIFPPKMEWYFADTYIDNPTLWEFASPITHVSQDSPPLLLIASQTDDTVPYEQSIELTQVYAEAGLEIGLQLLPNDGHAFWYFNESFDEMIEQASMFFHKHLDSK
ncbi:alpha/beta hydrolase [Gammaproteobacteria bacterium AH-315-E17]|nr:alpha/beta hydrolase [Gammaproteobacteria bacterium AH-315-E17]